jgi:hypothetical protein
LLANPTNSADLVDSYRKVLDHAPSYQLRPLGEETFDENLTVSELFSSIIPGVARHLPQHLVPGNLFGANDPEQQMTSAVWWPRTFAKQPTDASEHLDWNQSVPYTATDDGNQVVLQTIRFDRSRSFPLHEVVQTLSQSAVEHSIQDDEM